MQTIIKHVKSCTLYISNYGTCYTLSFIVDVSIQMNMSMITFFVASLVLDTYKLVYYC